MADAIANLDSLEKQVAELDVQRQGWQWSKDNPLAPLEAEILNVLEQLVSLYTNMTEAQRSHIRATMRNHPAVAMYLQAVATGDIRKFESEIPPERLYPALIAVSIANSNFGDYRDLIVLLGSLWRRSAQVGIDPAPYFQYVAELSDSDPAIDGDSMRKILANFHDYAYIKENAQ
jgi:hypothetical protein